MSHQATEVVKFGARAKEKYILAELSFSNTPQSNWLAPCHRNYNSQLESWKTTEGYGSRFFRQLVPNPGSELQAMTKAMTKAKSCSKAKNNLNNLNLRHSSRQQSLLAMPRSIDPVATPTKYIIIVA